MRWAPFTFGDAIPVDVDFGPQRVRVEWEATSSTTLNCPGRQPMAIDVWEHAYSIPGARKNGEHVFFLRGAARIVIDFTGAGVQVPFEGQIVGRVETSTEDWALAIRATSANGSRLELEHSGALDLQGETLDLDVTSGFFFNIEALP